HHLTLDHAHELVFERVPVALARPAPRRQRRQVDAELREPTGIAQLQVAPLQARPRKGGWIAGPDRLVRGLDIDLRHARVVTDGRRAVALGAVAFSLRRSADHLTAGNAALAARRARCARRARDHAEAGLRHDAAAARSRRDERARLVVRAAHRADV